MGRKRTTPKLNRIDLKKSINMVIESEVFDTLHYEIKDNHVIVDTEENGSFSIDINNVEEFCKELKDISDTFNRD